MKTVDACPVHNCAEHEGVLPSCAPLSVPYVPFQTSGGSSYSQTEALNNGTLFPALNLPFHLKEQAASVPDTPLSQLQALEFVLSELALYLDTHAEDQEAFMLFQQYAALEKKARSEYEAKFGPITLSAAASGKQYTWLKGPWPWCADTVQEAK